MFGFFIGLGVFWLFVWLFVFIAGIIGRHDLATGFGILGIVTSLAYIIAMVVSRLLSGI